MNPYYAQEKLAGLSPGNLVQPTVTERLEHQKAYLEDQLKMVNDALDALKRNPGVEEVMNLVQKASY